jgi:hypothetical protein
MNINKYQESKDFDRNEAIYILHTLDKKTLEEIAASFQLAIEEISEIITLHSKYEALIIETNN